VAAYLWLVAATRPSRHTLPCAAQRAQRTALLFRRPQEASVRRALVAAPGFTLLSADYRQVELRILAHLRQGGAGCGAVPPQPRCCYRCPPPLCLCL
jgi:hypothetical protein